MNFKVIGIYVTAKQDVILIPSGKSEKWGGAIVKLELYHLLEKGYTAEQLDQEIYQTFNECYSQKPNDELKPSAIEKYLNIKGYAKATKGMKFVDVSWSNEDGYVVVPTINLAKNGFDHMEDQKIMLGKNVKPGELAEAVIRAMAISE